MDPRNIMGNIEWRLQLGDTAWRYSPIVSVVDSAMKLGVTARYLGFQSKIL